MRVIEDAIVLSAAAHKGQKDKQGRPYIFHIIDVLSILGDAPEEVQIVAALHDIIEDTPMTIKELRIAGYSRAVVDAIDAITHQKSKETYADYIERCCQNPIARRVKLADVVRNMQRLDQLSDKDREKIGSKYADALGRLLDFSQDTYPADLPV